MRYVFFVVLICAVFFTACQKEKPVYLSGRYKMVYGYYEVSTDSGPTHVSSNGILMSRYAEFIDSNHVLLSDSIGFSGMVPVISSKYFVDGNTLYVDSAALSPFHLEQSGAVFTIESKVNADGLKNRYSK